MSSLICAQSFELSSFRAGEFGGVGTKKSV